MNDEADTARHYLDMCGLEVIEPEYTDVFLLELLYSIVNKKASKSVKPPISVFTMPGTVHGLGSEFRTIIQDLCKISNPAIYALVYV